MNMGRVNMVFQRMLFAFFAFETVLCDMFSISSVFTAFYEFCDKKYPIFERLECLLRMRWIEAYFYCVLDM